MPQLQLHPQSECPAVRKVLAEVDLSGVRYVLEGDLDRLRIPAPGAPRFADGLWRHTCFELFVRRDGANGYREFNFSPSGAWAAYDFTRYRERAAVLENPPVTIALRRTPGRLELEACVALEAGSMAGISAVIEDDAGRLSYWALRHPPGNPDFHHEAGFALALT